MRARHLYVTVVASCMAVFAVVPSRNIYASTVTQGGGMASDSNVVVVPDLGFEDDDTPPTSIRNASAPDTLRSYTLIGQRIYGKAKVSRTRTSYNIIIKNGRKVLKR